MVKNSLAMQETWVQPLSWEGSLEKEMATHFSILAWKITWTEEPGGLQSIVLQRVGHDLMTENSKQHFCQSNKINNLNFLSSFIYQLLCAYCSGWSNHCTSFKNLLLISIQSLRYHNQKQKSSRKTSISALLTMPKPLTLWITRNCGKF